MMQPPDNPADCSLKDVIDNWLELRCECGRVAYMPFRQMALTWPATLKMSDIAQNAACRSCRRPLQLISIVENVVPVDGRDMATGWRVLVKSPI